MDEVPSLEKSVIDIIVEIRTIKLNNDIDPNTVITIVVEATTLQEAETIYLHKSFIEKTARCKLYFPHTFEEYEHMSS